MLPESLNQLEESHKKSAGYQKGELIFRQGDKIRGLFYVVDGLTQLRRYSPDGDLIVIHTAKSGDTFAEVSLFSKTYHCDAKAVEKAVVIEIKKNSVLKLFNDNRKFALDLTGRFAQQIQAYRRKIELLAIRNATERVYVAMSEGLLNNDKKSFSSEIGLSHEVVYRSLSLLVKQDRIDKISRGKFKLRSEIC